MVLMTFGELTLIPVVSKYIADLAPADMRGRYLSFYWFAWGIARGADRRFPERQHCTPLHLDRRIGHWPDQGGRAFHADQPCAGKTTRKGNIMLKIRLLEHSELPLLKDFAPLEWNTNLSVSFSFHFGYLYYYPIVAELEGIIVGCAQGLLNGDAGWLGNIIVLPEVRGQGIGQALTQHLVEFFRAKGCTSQILVATQLGEPVYRKLGFIEVSRYVFLKRANPLAPEPISRVRQAEEKDFPHILALDWQATGEERTPFLGRFFETAWVYEKDPSEGVEGFYLPDLRDGPVIARTEQAGRALLKFKLDQGKTSVVVPEANIPALDFLKGAGFEETTSAPRMALGKDSDWKPTWVFSRGAGYCG